MKRPISILLVAAVALPGVAWADEAADPRWLSAAPGRVSLLLDSDGAALQIRAVFTAAGQPAAAGCFTPCALFVPPGPIELTYGTPDGNPRTETLSVGGSGAHLVLRPPAPPAPPPSGAPAAPAGPSTAARWLTGAGLMAGTIGVAATVSSLAYLGTGQSLYGDTQRNVYITLGVGPALMVAGVVMLLVGRTK